jgi:hypothetical protein
VTYDSSWIGILELRYSIANSRALTENEKEVVSHSESEKWAVCLECAIIDAGGLNVLSSCEACFEQYCL